MDPIKIYNENKWLFFLLLPIMLVLLFLKSSDTYQGFKILKDKKETNKKNEELKTKLKEEQAKRKFSEGRLDRLKEESKEIKGDENWNKRR